MINFIAKIRLNDHPNNQKISIYKKLYSSEVYNLTDKEYKLLTRKMLEYNDKGK